MATALELQHFAVLQIYYFYTATSIIIECSTNNPCHLWCYYTEKEPVRHATSLVKRGVALPWGAYFCFVAWDSVEQQQAGDTLIHTFEIPDWSYCQTKWFCFRGTVASELSPSVSALFKKHYGIKKYEHLSEPVYASYILYPPNDRYAQTFTPSQHHKLTAVRLRLGRTETPGIITIDVTHTDADKMPIPPPLTSGIIDTTDLPLGHPGEWIFSDLTPHILHIGTTYAIITKSETVGVTVTVAPPFSYLAERTWVSHNAGDTWSRILWPQLFQEWGTPL